MHTPSVKKRYLTGMDWVVNVLDAMSRHAGGRGNSSQIILEMDGNVPPQRLRTLLDTAAEKLPVIGGRIGRCWNLCPCWKFDPNRVPHIPLIVSRISNDSARAVSEIFGDHVNTFFGDPDEHLRFHLLNCEDGRAFLGMHFDHRLLDAFGAETFLQLLTNIDIGEEKDAIKEISLWEPPHLDLWKRRFIGGQNTNRLQIKLSREGIDALPLRNEIGPRDTRFETVHFTAEETGRIKENLNKSPGFILLLPYLLARVIGPLHELMKTRSCCESNYVIPVSLLRRTPDEIWNRLFFNHLSFAFFQVPASLAETSSELGSELQLQLYDQMKKGLPEDIYHASMLTRIVPLPAMRLLSRVPMNGKVATACFACLKESGFKSTRFLGANVNNLYHTPHVPIPPGLGVFMNFFRNRLNLVVSHVDDLLTDDEAHGLAEDMKMKLLEKTS